MPAFMKGLPPPGKSWGWLLSPILISLCLEAHSLPAQPRESPTRDPSIKAPSTENPVGELSLSSVSVEVRPSVVFSGGLVRARVRPALASAPDLKYHWVADSGLLLSDDLPEVEWRAPRHDPLRRVGPSTLQVTLSRAGEVFQASLKIDVLAPSTEGMVLVPGGSFLRGDARGTENKKETKTVQNSADEPCHTVDLDSYSIDRQLVTNKLYQVFLEDSLSQGLVRVERVAVMGEFDGAWVPFYYFQSFEDLIPQYHETRNARKPGFLHIISYDGSRFQIKPGKENCPVVDVTWFGAAAYARFYGKSLPTEAQWEKAARGADGRRYPWGNNIPTAYHANLNSYAGTEPTPVGNFSPTGDSPYGVADMLSGLLEWTNDWFNPDYYLDNLGEAPFRNPVGPFWGRSHSIRGAPLTLQFPQAASDSTEAVSFRYSWRFEFMIGDTFGNRQTGFRTVVTDGFVASQHVQK